MKTAMTHNRHFGVAAAGRSVISSYSEATPARRAHPVSWVHPSFHSFHMKPDTQDPLVTVSGTGIDKHAICIRKHSCTSMDA